MNLSRTPIQNQKIQDRKGQNTQVITLSGTSLPAMHIAWCGKTQSLDRSTASTSNAKFWKPTAQKRSFPRDVHDFRRTSRSSWPVQARKLSNSQRESQTKRKMSAVLSASAFLPEYVSIRHLRYLLRHGLSRWPRVAFHRNRKGAEFMFLPSHYRTGSRAAIAAAPGNQQSTMQLQLVE